MTPTTPTTPGSTSTTTGPAVTTPAATSTTARPAGETSKRPAGELQAGGSPRKKALVNLLDDVVAATKRPGSPISKEGGSPQKRSLTESLSARGHGSNNSSSSSSSNKSSSSAASRSSATSQDSQASRKSTVSTQSDGSKKKKKTSGSSKWDFPMKDRKHQLNKPELSFTFTQIQKFYQENHSIDVPEEANTPENLLLFSEVESFLKWVPTSYKTKYLPESGTGPMLEIRGAAMVQTRRYFFFMNYIVPKFTASKLKHEKLRPRSMESKKALEARVLADFKNVFKRSFDLLPPLPPLKKVEPCFDADLHERHSRSWKLLSERGGAIQGGRLGYIPIKWIHGGGMLTLFEAVSVVAYGHPNNGEHLEFRTRKENIQKLHTTTRPDKRSACVNDYIKELTGDIDLLRYMKESEEDSVFKCLLHIWTLAEILETPISLTTVGPMKREEFHYFNRVHYPGNPEMSDKRPLNLMLTIWNEDNGPEAGFAPLLRSYNDVHKGPPPTVVHEKTMYHVASDFKCHLDGAFYPLSAKVPADEDEYETRLLDMRHSAGRFPGHYFVTQRFETDFQEAVNRRKALSGVRNPGKSPSETYI